MKQIKLYTADYCPYCRRAEKLLNDKGIPFESFDVTHDDSLREWLVKETGRKTVPQIFIDGKSIGGFDDLNALNRSGELEKLLA